MFPVSNQYLVEVRPQVFVLAFALYVQHTDREREWAYDRESRFGKLDRGLDEARAKGWAVVDMQTDWKEIFAGR